MAGTQRGRRLRLAAVLTALLVVAGFAAGLSRALADTTSPSPGTEKIVIRFGWTTDPDQINPFTGYESSATELDHLNYDLLVGYDAKTLAHTPELAESWSHNDAGTVWTFNLRKGVKWSDGEPFTAEDVLWTYKFILADPSNYYYYVLNYVTDVKALDDYTVELTTSKPKASILNLWIPILPEHIWSKVDPKTITASYQNPPPVVGTGPFQVVERKKGDFVRLKANKNYWRGAPKVDELIFQTYQNQDTMVQDLKRGNLAAAYNIPEAQFPMLGKTKGITAIAFVDKGFTELGFNCYQGATSRGNPVLKDWKFRQALNWAIDKDKILAVAYSGYGNPATSLVQSNYYHDPDYHWEPPADVKYTYDPEKAKAALDAAGYTDTNGDGIRDYRGKPITLRLWARSQSASSQRAGKFIAGWLKAVGLRIKYEVLDQEDIGSRQFETDKKTGKPTPDYDMFLWSWGGDPDPDFILQVLLTSQFLSWSDTFYSNAEYDRLFQEQQTTIDPDKRKAIIDQMQQIVYRESPYIILAYDKTLEAYNTDEWEGWVRTPYPDGGVFYMADNIDTYLFVHPKTAEAKKGGGGLGGGAIGGIAVAAVVVIGAAVFVVLRRRGGKEAEEV